ncbi:hypothetical protein V8F06_007292 [Rhypophila decipiens]
MGSKRNCNARALDGDDDPSTGMSNKRHQDRPPSKSRPAQPKVDPTYGQRAAFPGLDGPIDLSDNELEYEDAGDALSYLRSVRHEAGGIPNLLVAPKTGPQLPPGFYARDNRGYYEDGAYVAAPDTESSEEPDGPSEGLEAASEQIHEAFYASIVSHFTAIRKILHSEPPRELIDALPPDCATYVGHFGSRSKTLAQWTRRIRNTDPRPVQIAAMSPESVFKLIRVLLKSNLMTLEDGLRERTSRWIWALLARLPDRGELDHRDISWIRDLGKRAVLMMADKEHAAVLREQMQDDLESSDLEDQEEHAIPAEEPILERDEGEIVEEPSHDVEHADHAQDQPEATSTTPEENDDENGAMDMEIDEGEVSSDDEAAPAKQTATDIELAKARLLSNLGLSTSAQETGQVEEEDELAAQIRCQINMNATLNMILTVAGEFYGQLDLLAFRNPFPGE